ncbi:MAG TPA: 5'-3' exonuclease H3TH domain-containing protein, partial [Polyangiaceae bacterium]|nr:5'-3' exonuclease H3TH domain-containing protein [Polyangiaceae bacterium]
DVFLWDGAQRLRGPAEIQADKKHPVPPRLIPDFLAIVGDAGDNVRGVKGLGPVAAAAILKRYGSVQAALQVDLPSIDTAAIKNLEKEIARAKGAGVENRRAELHRLRAERDLGKWLAELQAHRADVELAKRLVTLDAGAPIVWNLKELAIGGYDVEAIRRAYRALGLKNLAEEVRFFPKEPFGREVT